MKRKYLIIFTGFLLLLTIVVSSIGWAILRKFSAISVEELEQLITQQTDYVVSIAKVKPRWAGVNLVFRVEEIAFREKITNLPVLHVAYIESKLNLWQTIRSMDLRFSRIIVDTPKIVVNVDLKKQLTTQDIYAYLSTKTNLFPSLKFLGDIRGLSIFNGEIIFPSVDNKDLTIKQINLQASFLGEQTYKFQSDCNVSSMEQSALAIEGNFSGEFTKLNKARINLNVKGKNLNLLAYLNFINAGSNIQQMFGREMDVSLVWKRGKLHKAKGTFLLSNILLADNSKIPNTKLTAGYLEKDKVAKFKFDGLEYRNDNIFNEAIHISSLEGKATWQNQDNILLFDIADIVIELPEIKLKADVGASYQDGKITDVTLHGIADSITVEAAQKYVPTKILTKELSAWLTRSIRKGTILSNSLVFRKGKFDWMMNFKDVTLAYDVDWPMLTELSGNLHLNEKQITIIGVNGKILDIPIGMTIATIEGLNNKEVSPLVIDGEINSTLPQGVKFLLSSPLKHIGQALDNYKTQGNIHLNLKLNIPIEDDKIITKVDGKLFIDNGIFVDPVGVVFSEVKGGVNFTEQTISSNDLELKFIEQQTVGKINYDESKSKLLEVALTTKFKDKFLINLLPILASTKLNGESSFEIKVGVPMDNSVQKQIIVSSDLLGMSLDLPSPLGKTKEEKTKFSLLLQDDDLSKLQIAYNDGLNGSLVLGDHKLKAGDLMLGMQNKTEAKEQNALSIKGSLPECDLYTWLQTAAKNRELTNLPINLDLLIDKLNIFDNQFHAVSLRYNSQDNKIYLNSDKIVGVVKLSTNESPVKLDFDKIIIDGVEQIKTKSQALTPDNLPTVEFKCKNLILKGNTVGWIKFNLIPKPYGYDIKDVSIENENFDLQGNGQWNMLDKQTTHFIGNITGRNIGNLFVDWGLGRSIKRGSGNIAFTFNWNGSPIDFKFADTVGDVNIDIVTGHIRGVNPGFGRVIGLLSLDNIQRRLKLDFSDFVGKGFAFDKLQTVFNINHGTLHTEGIFIDGPSAYIALTGDAYIKTKQINFKMGVVPKMGSSLPLAAAITAGPVIGAAFLILGKAAGHKEDFKKIPRYGYNVTGTWENPEIHEIKKKKKDME